MALSTASYYNLGQKASHGCIRLLVADAKWVYDNCGAGTEVEVFKGKSDPEGTMALKPPALNKANMLPVVTPQPTPQPKYDPNAQPPQPYRTLEVGVSGLDVFWLQSRLTALGYYTGSITGGYYNGTRDAVKKYQSDNKLSADGKAGQITQKHIYAYLAVTPTPKPTPTPTPLPRIAVTDGEFVKPAMGTPQPTEALPAPEASAEPAAAASPSSEPAATVAP